jgi:hypothetical protein
VHVLHARQVHVFFRAVLPKPSYGVGHESLEVQLFDLTALPWADLAFPSTEFALRHYLDDRQSGRDAYHFTSIDRRLRGVAQS